MWSPKRFRRNVNYTRTMHELQKTFFTEIIIFCFQLSMEFLQHYISLDAPPVASFPFLSCQLPFPSIFSASEPLTCTRYLADVWVHENEWSELSTGGVLKAKQANVVSTAIQETSGNGSWLAQGSRPALPNSLALGASGWHHYYLTFRGKFWHTAAFCQDIWNQFFFFF